MSQLKGHISQVIGPVVDVYFEGKNIDQALLLPRIHDALTIKRDDGRTPSSKFNNISVKIPSVP